MNVLCFFFYFFFPTGIGTRWKIGIRTRGVGGEGVDEIINHLICSDVKVPVKVNAILSSHGRSSKLIGRKYLRSDGNPIIL